jgi:hypothetical protein
MRSHSTIPSLLSLILHDHFRIREIRAQEMATYISVYISQSYDPKLFAFFLNHKMFVKRFMISQMCYAEETKLTTGNRSKLCIFHRDQYLLTRYMHFRWAKMPIQLPNGEHSSLHKCIHRPQCTGHTFK